MEMLFIKRLNLGKKYYQQLASEQNEQNLEKFRQLVDININKVNSYSIDYYANFVFALFIYAFDKQFNSIIESKLGNISETRSIKKSKNKKGRKKNNIVNETHINYVLEKLNNINEFVDSYDKLELFINEFEQFIDSLDKSISEKLITIRQDCCFDIVNFINSYNEFVLNNEEKYHLPVKLIFSLFVFYSQQSKNNSCFSKSKRRKLNVFSVLFSKLSKIKNVNFVDQFIEFLNEDSKLFENENLNSAVPYSLISEVLDSNKLIKIFCQYSDIKYIDDSYGYYSSNCEWDDGNWNHEDYIRNILKSKLRSDSCWYLDIEFFKKQFDKVVNALIKELDNPQLSENSLKSRTKLLQIMLYIEIYALFASLNFVSDNENNKSNISHLKNFTNLIHNQQDLKNLQFDN
jgi:hypothetical protein